jgi:hypothetical protein
MRIPMHPRSLIPIARCPADIVGGALAALVFIILFSLAIGAAALDVARLFNSVLPIATG